MKNFKSFIIISITTLALIGGLLYDAHLIYQKAQASYTPLSNSGLGVPQWVKITKTYTDFSTASVTNTITISTLAIKGIVQGCQLSATTPFAGGLIATYTIKVDAGGVALCTATNVFTGTTFTPNLSSLMAINSVSGTTNVTATAVSTVGNLSAATAGSVDIWLLISQLP